MVFLLVAGVAASITVYIVSYALLTLLAETVSVEKRQAISHLLCVLFFLSVIVWILTR